jgi:hypothetical protein
MSNYFNKVPNFEYVSRLPNAKIGDYIQVKNFFKKGKLRDDIFQNLAFFTKYQIVGDDRPDNVAFETYGDSSLDWLVLLCNNIINIQTEWPMTQQAFDDYVLDKYGSYEQLNEIHHYETIEFKNSQGVTIVPAGLQVPENYTVDFYDYFGGGRTLSDNLAVPVTNYEYEDRIENNKRNIFLLKPRYLNVVLDDMDDIMAYKQGSTQYVSETLKRADNIKLYS